MRHPALRGLVATLVALTVVGCAGRRKSDPSAAASKPLVTVVQIEKQTVPIVTHGANGTSRALEEVTIRARVQGFLVEKHFEEGKDVEKDQLLLVIDRVPFQNLRDQAAAKLAAAQAELERSEKSKSREVAAAQVAVESAMLVLAEVEARRERALLARNATPKEEVDRKDALLKKAQAQLESSRATLEQTRIEFGIDIAAARAAVGTAQAELENAKIQLGYCEMRSPISGRTGELLVKLGNVVGPSQNTELVTVRQLDPMGIEFRPSSRYLPRLTELVRQGMKVSLALQGAQGKPDRPHPDQATAFFLDNQVDLTTSTVLMKARVPNTAETLLPGEFVKASAVIGEMKDVLVVPERAVFETQEGLNVYVVEKGTVQRSRIKPADEATLAGQVVVAEGLSAGQQVIVDGLQFVRQGMEVETETETQAQGPKAKGP